MHRVMTDDGKGSVRENVMFSPYGVRPDQRADPCLTLLGGRSKRDPAPHNAILLMGRRSEAHPEQETPAGLQPAAFHLPLELQTPRCGVLPNAVLAQQAVHAHGVLYEPNHVRPPPATQTPKTASPPLPPLSVRFTRTNLWCPIFISSQAENSLVSCFRPRK